MSWITGNYGVYKGAARWDETGHAVIHPSCLTPQSYRERLASDSSSRVGGMENHESRLDPTEMLEAELQSGRIVKVAASESDEPQ